MEAETKAILERFAPPMRSAIERRLTTMMKFGWTEPYLATEDGEEPRAAELMGTHPNGQRRLWPD